MKNALALVTLSALILLSGCSSEILGKITEDHSEDPDYSYRINGKQLSPVVYEFTPKSNPNYTCIMATSDYGMGLSCLPKPTKNVKKVN